jgi:hypothetical protein
MCACLALLRPVSPSLRQILCCVMKGFSYQSTWWLICIYYLFLFIYLYYTSWDFLSWFLHSASFSTHLQTHLWYWLSSSCMNSHKYRNALTLHPLWTFSSLSQGGLDQWMCHWLALTIGNRILPWLLHCLIMERISLGMYLYPSQEERRILHHPSQHKSE